MAELHSSPSLETAGRSIGFPKRMSGARGAHRSGTDRSEGDASIVMNQGKFIMGSCPGNIAGSPSFPSGASEDCGKVSELVFRICRRAVTTIRLTTPVERTVAGQL